MNAIHAIYADKPEAYFAGARDDIVAMMDTDERAAVLELGCGNGATGLAVLAAGKAGRYVGIELDPVAATIARGGLSRVLTGDVAEMNLGDLANSFDALIISEVMEHLVDPWTVLAKLVTCLRPGATVYASSPNAAHWRVILGLLRGRFDYEHQGVMDRTHLRWFTPDTFRELFSAAGLTVLSVAPSAPLRPKAALLNRLTFGRLAHLLPTQMMLVARL